MSKYALRKNFTATFSDREKTVRGKLAFKTKETDWLGTESSTVILVSIHSAFHEGEGGDLKMNALLSVVKNHVKGKVTVLLAAGAHLQTMSLDYQGNLELAFKECLASTLALSHRYRSYFKDCNVVDWHSYICEDKNFGSYLTFVKEAYEKDLIFRELLHLDAEATYTFERMQKISNKALFIDKAIDDILEQCASLLVLAEKGYRFQFYPGSPYASVDHAVRMLFPQEKRIRWIDVFLTIEKKTITKTDEQMEYYAS